MTFKLHRRPKPRGDATLMVTGGTGSLGQAIVEKLVARKAYDEIHKIIIYSRDERKQEDMANKFSSYPGFDKLRFFIGDVRDYRRLEGACSEVTHIIHAAALKVVPSIEYNPEEAVKTNIAGSQNLIHIANRSDIIQKVLVVSTDKAVSPTNLYGATKLAMEKLTISANNFNRAYGPKFSVVRYGNVSGSRGSVIPVFLKQAKSCKSLTITHKDMTRFWITLEDARDFVLKCLEIMNGEEVFIPDMPSYKIIDLAEVIQTNIHAKPLVHTIVGIRPGEKIHEEIISVHDMPYVTSHSGYYVITKQIQEDYMNFMDETGLPRLSFTSQTNNVTDDVLEKLLRGAGFLGGEVVQFA